MIMDGLIKDEFLACENGSDSRLFIADEHNGITFEQGMWIDVSAE